MGIGLKEDQTKISVNMTIVDDLIILGVRFEKDLKEKIDKNLKLKSNGARAIIHSVNGRGLYSRVNVPISDPSLFATRHPTLSSKYDLKWRFRIVINWLIACIQTNYASFHHSITLVHFCMSQ